jgi:hypothetical protein
MARVETMEYLGAARRFIRAAGLRVAAADEPELAELLALRTVVDEAVQTAVDGMRDRGMSWAYIASATGTSRQAAQMRYGRPAHTGDDGLPCRCDDAETSHAG